jgi:hypothetical protein
MLEQSSILLTALVLGLPLAACGTYVPQMEEFWEPVGVTPSMELKIKENIFCETVQALRDVNQDIRINGRSIIPDDFGVQMQINLTVEEVGGINPSVGFADTLENAIVHKLTVPQSVALNAGGTLSSTATRTDTSYSYYNVGQITQKGAQPFCKDLDLTGSSPLLKSNLGIESFLREAAPGALVFNSSPLAKGGFGKGAKLDVFSYEIKFAVVTNASINPVWKLII